MPRAVHLGEEVRSRLGRRFGSEIESWLNGLPPVLGDLAERWQIEFEALVDRGSMSVVIRCRKADERPAVLKVTPDHGRARDEAAALVRWTTARVPTLLAVDEDVGALLIEAIEPGTSLDDSMAFPDMDDLSALMIDLHTHGEPDPSYRSVAERVAYLYDAGRKNYVRRPELAQVVPPELYEQGRRLAMRLAEDEPAAGPVLLHGDLTPTNVLDGGQHRGLVAIDPAPCLGDPAFDAIDLVLWGAADAETVSARAERLTSGLGTDPRRLIQWCYAFAAMTALELAEASGPDERVEMFVGLARAGT